MEAPPVGTVGLEIQNVLARSVEVRFTGVDEPNGIVYYDVYFDGLYYVSPGEETNGFVT